MPTGSGVFHHGYKDLLPGSEVIADCLCYRGFHEKGTSATCLHWTSVHSKYLLYEISCSRAQRIFKTSVITNLIKERQYDLGSTSKKLAFSADASAKKAPLWNAFFSSQNDIKKMLRMFWNKRICTNISQYFLKILKFLIRVSKHFLLATKRNQIQFKHGQHFLKDGINRLDFILNMEWKKLELFGKIDDCISL